MSTYDINDIVIQAQDDITNFYDHSISLTPLSDILDGCSTMDMADAKINILNNHILVLYTDKEEIRNKITDFLQAIKSKIFKQSSSACKNIQFLHITDANELSKIKAKLAVIPGDVNISNIDTSLTPTVKIFSETFYKQNPGKKIATWNRVLDILTS